MPTQPAPKAQTSLRIMRIRLVFLALALAVMLPAADASAQGRHASLSKDLIDKISTGDTSRTSAIFIGTQSAADALASRHRVRISKRLRTGVVLDIPAGSLEAVANDAGVDVLSGNQVLQSNMATTEIAIGADQAWEGLVGGMGVTGSGVGVAVIDSGIAGVNAVGGRVVASLDFTDDNGKGIDKHGHGTHVAGIIAAAGSGQQSGVSGVAPGAHLVSLKVLDENGRGTADLVIEAIDWVVANHARYGIRVINMSLGGAVLQSWQDDPICQAVERAYDADITIVASAGNFGRTEDGTPISGAISVPGNCPHSITVGALNTKGTAFRSDDVVASYSSKGPTLYDNLIKPDLVAPGNRIRGLAVPGSTLVKNHPELVTGTGANAQLEMSGTSMAAAVVSGAVALLLDQQSALTPQMVRVALQFGAELPSGARLVEWGAGSLNVLSSLAVAEAGPRFVEIAIGGVPVQASGLVFGATVVWGDAATVVWGEAKTVVWGEAKTVVWGEAKTVVWGEAKTVVWGEAATVVWGEAKTVVWGEAKTVVWGEAKTVVWGEAATVVWGEAATVVWGEAKTVVWGEAKTVVWGEAKTVVWGEAKTVVWGEAKTVVWGEAKTVVWGE